MIAVLRSVPCVSVCVLIFGWVLAARSSESSGENVDSCRSQKPELARGNMLFQIKRSMSHGPLGLGLGVPLLADDVHAVFSRDKQSASVVVTNGGRPLRYQLFAYNNSKGGPFVALMKQGPVPVDTEALQLLRSQDGRRNRASLVLHENGSFSGLFEDGGRLLVLELASPATHIFLEQASWPHWVPTAPWEPGYVPGGVAPLSSGVWGNATDGIWFGEPWYPGCYSGDSQMNVMNIGIVADVPLYQKYNNTGKLAGLLLAAVAQASFVFEMQMHIRLNVQNVLIYTDPVTAPSFAKDCSNSGADWKQQNFQPPQSWQSLAQSTLFTACPSPKGITGYASRTICKGATAAVQYTGYRAWGFFAHELGHNFNGGHTVGGILDAYGADAMVDRFYQFYTLTNRPQMCSTLNNVVNRCGGNFTVDTIPPTTTSPFPVPSATVTTTTTTPIPSNALPCRAPAVPNWNCASGSRPIACSPGLSNCGGCRNIRCNGYGMQAYCSYSVADGFGPGCATWPSGKVSSCSSAGWVLLDLVQPRLVNQINIWSLYSTTQWSICGLQIQIVQSQNKSFKLVQTVVSQGLAVGPSAVVNGTDKMGLKAYKYMIPFAPATGRWWNVSAAIAKSLYVGDPTESNFPEVEVLYTGSYTAGVPTTTTTTTQPARAYLARYVRVRCLNASANWMTLTFAGIAVLNTGKENVASQQLVSASTPGKCVSCPVFFVPRSTNPNASFFVTNFYDTDPWWMVDLMYPTWISQVDFYNANGQDDRNYQIELVDQNGNFVYGAPLPGNNVERVTTFLTACFEEGFIYVNPYTGSPNMAGQERTATSMWQCQLRCQQTSGCAHFVSYRDGGCHLQDSNATRVAFDYALSGPPACAPK